MATRLKKLKESLTQFPPVEAPPLWLTALELRCLWEIGAGMLGLKTLERMTLSGDGHPVLVLPGLGTSDTSTALVRKFLTDLGYITYGWDNGQNKGINDELILKMQDKLREIYSIHLKKVSIIGHSLGGVLARELARTNPKLVRQVITLGSPFTGHPLANSGGHLYEWLSGDKLDNMDFDRHFEIRRKPPVPTTSLYSKYDGVVAWRCSVEDEQPEGESINVRGCSHIGMGSNPVAMYLIAERLGQRQGEWRPFQPKGLEQVFYGPEDHKS